MTEYNLDFCKVVNDGKSIEVAPSELSPGAGTPTEQEYNEAGWYKNKIADPAYVPADKNARLLRYEHDLVMNAIVAVYEFVD